MIFDNPDAERKGPSFSPMWGVGTSPGPVANPSVDPLKKGIKRKRKKLWEQLAIVLGKEKPFTAHRLLAMYGDSPAPRASAG